MPISFPLAILAVLFRRFLDSFHYRIPQPEPSTPNTAALVMLSGALYYLYTHISRGMLVRVGHRPKNGFGWVGGHPHMRRALQNNLSRIFNDFTNRKKNHSSSICNLSSPSPDHFRADKLMANIPSNTLLMSEPTEVHLEPHIPFSREYTPTSQTIVDDTSICENDDNRSYSSQYVEHNLLNNNDEENLDLYNEPDLTEIRRDSVKEEITKQATQKEKEANNNNRRNRMKRNGNGKKHKIKPIIISGGINKKTNETLITKSTRSGKTYGNIG